MNDTQGKEQRYEQPKGLRVLSGKDNIPCQHGRYGDSECTQNSDVCETLHWDTGNTQGTSFFYFCGACWQANEIGRNSN